MPHLIIVTDRLLPRCTLLLAITMLGGCRARSAELTQLASAEPAERTVLPPSPDGVHAGEAMTFAISVAGVEVGEAAVAVGQPGDEDGQRVLVVSGRATATGMLQLVHHVAIAAESRIAFATGRPVDLAASVIWGARHSRAKGRFAGPYAEIRWLGAGAWSTVLHDIGDGVVHSAPTAVAAVRGWTGVPGEIRHLYVAGGFRLFRADLRWGGREVIGTAVGNFPAVRLDGIAQVVDDLGGAPVPSRIRFSAWLSDDADRVPLRVVGHAWVLSAVIELTSYQR